MKRVFTLLLLACCLLIAPAAAAGGSGTAADPYIIQTAAELQSIQNNLAAYYKLANDIDLSGVTWLSIGSESAPFIGSFDGAGYTISDLIISPNNSQGFFGCLGSGAMIKNVTFNECHATSNNSGVAILSGKISMSSTIHNVISISAVNCVDCTINSVENHAGVLIGIMYASSVVDITNCNIYHTIIYTTHSYIGIIGLAYDESVVSLNNIDINNCILKANYNRVGIIGCVASSSSVDMDYIDINNCIFDAGGSYVGVIGDIISSSSVVLNNVVIDKCTLKGTTYAGGIAGHMAYDCTGVFDNCTVSDCTIIANTYAAGICPAYN